MKRYSIIFCVMGVLAGIAILFYSFMTPKTVKAPAPLAPETLVYNVGKAHELPGTDSMLYENPVIGLRFGYPKSYGEVVVEKRDGGVFFSFSQSGETNDPKRVYFMAAQYMEPKGHAGYWGDMSWYAEPDPRWMQERDVCAVLKSKVVGMPSWAQDFVNGPLCINVPFGDGGIAKLANKEYTTYLIPAFHTASDGVSLDMYAASTDRFRGKTGFETIDPEVAIEKLVKSLEFIETTE